MVATIKAMSAKISRMSVDAYHEIVSRFGHLSSNEQKQLVRELTLAVGNGNGASQSMDIRHQFDTLASRWRATRGHQSRIDRLVINEAYQAIIGLGPAVVALLLKEMDEQPDHWDWALRAITQSDPVPRENWGDLKAIAAAWIRWGRDNGYRW